MNFVGLTSFVLWALEDWHSLSWILWSIDILSLVNSGKLTFFKLWNKAVWHPWSLELWETNVIYLNNARVLQPLYWYLWKTDVIQLENFGRLTTFIQWALGYRLRHVCALWRTDSPISCEIWGRFEFFYLENFAGLTYSNLETLEGWQSILSEFSGTEMLYLENPWELTTFNLRSHEDWLSLSWKL